MIFTWTNIHHRITELTECKRMVFSVVVIEMPAHYMCYEIEKREFSKSDPVIDPQTAWL